MELAERVRGLVAAGFEVRALAAVCGVTHPLIYRLMSGTQVSARSEARIAAGLARIASIAAGDDSDATAHPGIAALLADAAACRALPRCTH